MAGQRTSCTMPDSPIDGLPRPYAVALHDAGAANMVIEWCSVAAHLPSKVWAEGPAKGLWEARFDRALLVKDSKDLLASARSLVSGTGWASDLEHRARIAAARDGIFSVAVIDHWVNYAVRFHREGGMQLPDAIWVGDAHAYRVATETFHGVTVVCHNNQYLDRQAEGAGPVPTDGDVLFVAEPARSDWGAGEQGEFQSLDHFMASRSSAGIPQGASIRLRPHPSDPDGKYDNWIARHAGVTLDCSPDLQSALRQARWVVGLNSMALVIAMRSGRAAFSALPPNAPPCALPYEEIRRL